MDPVAPFSSEEITEIRQHMTEVRATRSAIAAFIKKYGVTISTHLGASLAAIGITWGGLAYLKPATPPVNSEAATTAPNTAKSDSGTDIPVVPKK